MQKVKKAIMVGVAAGALFLSYSGVALADCASGSTNPACQGVNASNPGGVPTQLFGTGSIFQTIADLLIFIVGALAVIMLIVGGLRYVLSSGNSSAVEGAKNTILYAIIGIVVAILAFAAVNFVVGQVSKAQ